MHDSIDPPFIGLMAWVDCTKWDNHIETKFFYSSLVTALYYCKHLGTRYTSLTKLSENWRQALTEEYE